MAPSQDVFLAAAAYVEPIESQKAAGSDDVGSIFRDVTDSKGANAGVSR